MAEVGGMQVAQGNMVANGPSPEDAQLSMQLESRLKGAEEAIEHHRTELARAGRVAEACRAGLRELNAPMDKPVEPEPY